MTARGTLVLWTLVVALGVYLWAGTRTPGERDPRPPAGAPLLDFDPGAVTGLTVTDAGGSVSLVRRGAGWLTSASGRQIPADVVDGLLATLAGLPPLMVIASADDLDDYGLDRPRQEIVFAAVGSDDTLRLALGDYNPAGTAVYARRADDDAVFLVGAVIRWETEKVVRAVRQDPR